MFSLRSVLLRFLLTAAVGMAVAYVIALIYSDFYLSRHLLKGDVNSYFYLYIKALEEMAYLEPAEFGLRWILGNDRMPYQYLVLWAYKLIGLSDLVALTFINAPAFFYFLLLVSRATYSLSKSWVVVYLSTLVVVISTVTLDINLGVLSFYPEGSSAFFYAASALCLLMSNKCRDAKWMSLFGVSACLVTLSRYVAVAYVLFLAVPLIVIYAYSNSLRPSAIRNMVKASLPALAIITILSMPYLVHHLSAVADFYKTFGYALGNVSWEPSFLYLKSFFVNYALMDVVSVIAMTSVSLIVLIKSSSLTVFSYIWAGLAHLIFMIFFLKISGDAQTVIFAFTGLTVMSVLMFAEACRSFSKAFQILVVTLVVLKAGYVHYAFRKTYLGAGELKDLKFYDEIQAGVLNARQNVKTVRWAAMWAEDFVKPAYLGWKKTGNLLLSDQYYMTNHLSHWRGFYRDFALPEVQAAVYQRLLNEVAVVVVRHEPRQKSFPFENHISEEVAAYISAEVRHDPRWEFSSAVAGGPYGPMDIFKKARRMNAGLL